MVAASASAIATAVWALMARLPYAGAPVPRHDVRLPDERARLGAHQGHARGARPRRGGDARRTPTSSSSTPARSARSRTRSSPRTSATRARASASIRTRSSPSAAATPRRSGSGIFSLYPQVDVAFGPGTIAHLGEWLGAGGLGVARGAWGTGEERAFAADAADAPRAHASRRGCRSRWAATRCARTASCPPCAAAKCRAPAGRDPRRDRRPRGSRACAR